MVQGKTVLQQDRVPKGQTRDCSNSYVITFLSLKYSSHFQDAEDNPLEANVDYSMTPKGALIIKNIEDSDQGTYTCIVENTVGRTEASAIVRIVCKFSKFAILINVSVRLIACHHVVK